MKWVEDMLLWHGLQPRVTHRLPGRLRLNIPLLRHLPDDWLDLAALLEQAVSAPLGIRRVKSDRRSGSLLIDFDPGALREADVLGYLRSLLLLLRRHRHRLDNLTKPQAMRVARKLKAWLRTHTRSCPAIDPEADIPDAIWT